MNTSIIAALLAISLGVSGAAQTLTHQTPESIAPVTIVSEEVFSNPTAEEPSAYPTAPTEYAEFHAVWDYAYENNCSEVTLHYAFPYTDEFGATITDCVKESSQVYRYTHPEIFNYMRAKGYRRIRHDDSFDIIIEFSAIDDTVTMQQKGLSDAKAVEVYNSLRASGALTDAMTERERAWVILSWVCDNTYYMNDGTGLCHTAYSVFERGYGVCDAYVSAFQSLLLLDGIDCFGVKGNLRESNERHLWSKVCLDGQWVNIDPVGCDGRNGTNDMYFAISDEILTQTHAW